MNDVVQCGGCEAVLADETPQDKERDPCPACGSVKRIIHKEVADVMQLYDSIRLRQQEPGTKKPVLDHFSGFDLTHKTGQFSEKIRIIDRKNDSYYEMVRDPKTGAILHECSEALSQHFGHGSAKFKDHGLSHEDISVAAYFIWMKEGCPHGRDVAHWFLAIEELRRMGRNR